MSVDYRRHSRGARAATNQVMLPLRELTHRSERPLMAETKEAHRVAPLRSATHRYELLESDVVAYLLRMCLLTKRGRELRGQATFEGSWFHDDRSVVADRRHT